MTDRHRAEEGGSASAQWLAALARAWPTLDPYVYVVWCAVVIAFACSIFVSAMKEQTVGEWSAPLDDTFIHFDYARSAARGRPFEWSIGNGYSSGSTSTTYPLVLAIGWAAGFREQRLVSWAMAIACISLLTFFVAGARYTKPLGAWAKYAIAPLVLSVGALDWTLFSGMENAFHLGIWGLASLQLERIEELGARLGWRALWALGFSCALLVLTRPESVVCVVAFVFAVLWCVRRSSPGWRKPLASAALVAVIPMVALAGISLLNRAATGEWSQSGAITKLALFDPYLTRAERVADWWSNLKFSLGRLVYYHFARAGVPGAKGAGFVLPGLALLPLAHPKLRGRALFLWVQVAGWMSIVALNGQVRWQNQRYLMSGVAWGVLLAAMGVAALASRYGETLRGRLWWGARLCVAALALTFYWRHQQPAAREQVWFFARASRNIRDQQIQVGRLLASIKEPKPKRILVGDAGAIMYASDLPGLDLIGLGGFHDYPFARAQRHGVGASLELLERMQDDDRPNYMAIYPSWWGEMPAVFGDYFSEVAIRGNVICGAPSKVIYLADWSPMERDAYPRGMAEGESVVGELDVADLVSEQEHRYRGKPGRVVWRALPSPDDRGRDLFDAGRTILQGERESFEITFPRDGGRLIVRTVDTSSSSIRVLVEGRDLGTLDVRASETWSELWIELPKDLPIEGRVELVAETGTWTNYHVFTTTGDGG